MEKKFYRVRLKKTGLYISEVHSGFFHPNSNKNQWSEVGEFFNEETIKKYLERFQLNGNGIRFSPSIDWIEIVENNSRIVSPYEFYNEFELLSAK